MRLRVYFGVLFPFRKKYPHMTTSLPTPALRRKLSDAFLRAIAEPGKYVDGEVPGLYLHVQASQKSNKPAAKYWRMR